MDKKSRKKALGLSFETAIVLGKDTEDEGVAAEYKYIREHYPGYTPIEQQLRFKDGHSYDIITIVKHRRYLKIYFRIDEFLYNWKNDTVKKPKPGRKAALPSLPVEDFLPKPEHFIYKPLPPSESL